MLAYEDRWTELTGEPVARFYEWMLKPQEHAKYYRLFAEKMPLDIFQPARWRSGRETYEYFENTEIVTNEKGIFAHNKKDDTYQKLPGHVYDDDCTPVEKQIVFDKNDADKLIRAESAESMIEQGYGVFISEGVRELGGERFILSGGIMNVLYYASWYVGLTNLFFFLLDKPDLMEYIFKKLLEKNIERIRMIAGCGGDAIYIDDAVATNDMVSVDMYERFSLPYMKAQVDEIHRLGMKAFVTYFGGIADRVEQIVATGADALIMECSMKGYVNDYSAIAGQVGDRLCVCTNINPITEFNGTDDDTFKRIIGDYAASAKRHKKYIISTGSPVTPETPLERISLFVNTAHDA
jgi:uroporphyrinogen-III decarboxylase